MASRWTPEDSRVLSQMLDQVVGTPQMIDIRQDFCRLYDCIDSEFQQQNVYFTGSKAEGLDLPSSDLDFMYDINNNHYLKVIQSDSLDENPNISPLCIFRMCTDNTYPGFALLQHVPNVHQTMIKACLYKALQNINGSQYLNSDMFMERHSIRNKGEGTITKRQGPSLEFWNKSSDKSDSGVDHVISIHCAFWPNEAREWTNRVRNFNWPKPSDLSSIIKFGFHLVPIGHPHSDRKAMEWRISFSMAERALVWSFNHVQMQCYALMKILLKEFIKVKCNPQNQFLCSYFVKTFLFWKYETTKLNFWHEDNFRECMKFLLSEFSQCIRGGVLRHYFIPKFNLLSIKLTQAAQTELLQLLDIIIESDIRILNECKTLRQIWSEFLQAYQNRNNVICNLKKRIMLINDECIMRKIPLAEKSIEMGSHSIYKKIASKILDTLCKTPLKALLLRLYLFIYIRSISMNCCGSTNKDMYQIHQTSKNDNLSFDITTCKLWCAMLLYMRKDFSSTLDIVNQVLSNIPPYAMYVYNDKIIASNEDKELYASILLDSVTSVIERAKKAWMFCLCFNKDMSGLLPLGINIELYFTDKYIVLTPFTCAYYLQFLCYHEMHQYVKRDRALQQLHKASEDPEYIKSTHYDINILGHCLLLAGKRVQARYMFDISYELTQRHPPADKYNSALWYLQNFC